MSEHTQQSNGIPKVDNSDESIQRFAQQFNVTEDQIREAVKAVGSDAANVEEYLKGSRSSSNSERVRKEL